MICVFRRIGGLVCANDASRTNATADEDPSGLSPGDRMISLPFLLSQIKPHVETSLLDVIERNVVRGEIVTPPRTDGLEDAQRRDWLAVVPTRPAEEIDLESPRSQLREGPIIVQELPAAEHMTEDIGLMLESLPVHGFEWAA